MTISKQKTSLFFRLSISVTVFGALFKFISWPLILLGAMGMVIFHSIQFFQKKHRLALDYSRHLLIIAFSCNYVFSILSLPYVHILTLGTKAALIAFLLFYSKEIVTLHKEYAQDGLFLQNLGTIKLSYLLADLATVYIVLASLFKVLDWEFGIINATVLMVIGLFTALLSIMAGAIKMEP